MSLHDVVAAPVGVWVGEQRTMSEPELIHKVWDFHLTTWHHTTSFPKRQNVLTANPIKQQWPLHNISSQDYLIQAICQQSQKTGGLWANGCHWVCVWADRAGGPGHSGWRPDQPVHVTNPLVLIMSLNMMFHHPGWCGRLLRGSLLNSI